MSLHGWGNLLEACLWIGLGIGVLVKQRRAGLLVGLTLIAFGISDLIEIRTGDWRRPLGLLLLKAACLAVLLPAAFLAIRRSRSSRRDSPPAA